MHRDFLSDVYNYIVVAVIITKVFIGFDFPLKYDNIRNIVLLKSYITRVIMGLYIYIYIYLQGSSA